MINNGKSIIAISKETGICESTIRGLIRYKKVFLPKEYYENVLGRNTFLALDDDNNIVYEFSSFREADEAGFKRGTVYRALKKGQNKSYGYKWIYKKDYNKLIA